MKLRNKKTGESGYYLHTHRDYKSGNIKVAVLEDGKPFSEFKPHEPIYDYDSLAELNEDWEDYEGPKKYWYMDYGGRIKAMNDANDEEDMARKSIGNYFETKEEAEKAVEKLKAWKRLKDKGFRFTFSPGVGVLGASKGKEFCIDITASMPSEYFTDDEVPDDLDLLFGGEE